MKIIDFISSSFQSFKNNIAQLNPRDPLIYLIAFALFTTVCLAYSMVKKALTSYKIITQSPYKGKIENGIFTQESSGKQYKCYGNLQIKDGFLHGLGKLIDLSNNTIITSFFDKGTSFITPQVYAFFKGKMDGDQLTLSDGKTLKLQGTFNQNNSYLEGSGIILDIKNNLTYSGQFKKGLMTEGSVKPTNVDLTKTGSFELLWTNNDEEITHYKAFSKKSNQIETLSSTVTNFVKEHDCLARNYHHISAGASHISRKYWEKKFLTN